MSAKKLFDQNLLIQIECLYCSSIEQRSFRIGDTFNLEGDCILKESDQLYLCHTHCSRQDKTLFPPKTIRDLYNGFKSLENEEA